VEDREDLVDRGMVGPLLVAVVETVDLRQNDPERKREHDYRELDHERLGASGRRSEGPSNQHVGRREAEDVGNQEHTANEPAAPHHGTRPDAPGDDVQRPPVEIGLRRKNVRRRGASDRAHGPTLGL
jgi:hypothetical protein